jgi:hypothetical protein
MKEDDQNIKHTKFTVENKKYRRNPYISVPVAKTYSTYLLNYVTSSRKGTCLCRNMVPAKRNSWKSTLEKKEYGKKILFFCRNLEVIPQDSWNWKAKKNKHKKTISLLVRVHIGTLTPAHYK